MILLSHSSSMAPLPPGKGCAGAALSAAPRRVSFGLPFAHVGRLGVGSGKQKHQHKLPWQMKATQASPVLTTNFSGTWVKDKQRSSSMDDAIKLMGLGGLIRTAIKLIRGVQIKQDEENFTMAVFSVFSWFKVSEHYKMDGSVCQGRRRDFRKGKHRGTIHATAPDRLELSLEWDDPYSGTGVDVLTMPAPDELNIHTTLHSKTGETVAYNSVFTRKK